MVILPELVLHCWALLWAKFLFTSFIRHMRGCKPSVKWPESGKLGCYDDSSTVLFRLVSTELLEGDFYTCANTKRDNTKGDTKLPKRALLEENQEKHLGR
jgi:hypothetical protein